VQALLVDDFEDPDHAGLKRRAVIVGLAFTVA
jgi:hypothetical protein